MGTDIDWTGTWETNYGKVELLQKGNLVVVCSFVFVSWCLCGEISIFNLQDLIYLAR